MTKKHSKSHDQAKGASGAAPESSHPETVRAGSEPTEVGKLPADRGRIKILIVYAQPEGQSRLRVDEEARDVSSILKSCGQRAFEVDVVPAARREDLEREIPSFCPAFLHFCGHGTAEGILLGDSTVRAQTADTAFLVEFLKTFPSLYCVVLNSCFSDAQAGELTRVIPCLVSMQGTINDGAAVKFSKDFYFNLCQCGDVETAYERACACRVEPQRSDASTRLHPILKINRIPHRRRTSGARRGDPVELFDEIRKRIDKEEFKTLCFRLGVDVDDIPGENKTGRVRELIQRFQRRGQLEEFRESWSRFLAEQDPL
jgi:hypothetical protein